jgi:putative phosphoribosyl transferase
MEKTKVLDECPVVVNAGKVTLEGGLCLPPGASGVVVFAHSNANSRHNPRNHYLAQVLRQSGLATLLFDLLTDEEEKVDIRTGRYRFDTRMLTNRLVGTMQWLKQNPETKDMNIGYFGAGNGAAAALMAAAEHPGDIGAVVSRGGRPDLARSALPYVKSPTLLIVSGRDLPVLAMNRDANAELHVEKKLVVIPGVAYLDEPGTLEEVARLATNWFANYLHRKVAYSAPVTAAR